ncbi:UNVERIFIED_CONTAM: Elicitor-responsive protein 3 [Sesamum calycinum]|uniref:Elicitor-responsive protein 3 n=1 Tax=Sesamum calycinum TaxID=2727403 RepID=A0AAW2QZV6_9LAMI
MVRGTLEVLLVGAKGLENTDFLSNMDPYVTITCRTQEKKSSVASGKGSDPEWNETFVFALSDDVPELLIKILDSDGVSGDDFVGEAKIPLEPLFAEGSIPPTSYNVVKDEEYCGEIRVGLNFTPEASRKSSFRRVLEAVRRDLVNKKKAMVAGRSLHIEVDSHQLFLNYYPYLALYLNCIVLGTNKQAECEHHWRSRSSKRSNVPTTQSKSCSFGNSRMQLSSLKNKVLETFQTNRKAPNVGIQTAYVRSITVV